MPALPSPGRVVKLVWQYKTNDCIAENIFYFNYNGSGAPAVSDLSNLAGHIETDLAAPYVGASLDTTTGQLATYTDLQSSSGAVYSHVPSWTGTNSGADLPGSAAVVVSHEILRRYRGGHPRTYMMVGSASDFLSGSQKFWQAAFLANIQAGWNSYAGLFPYNAPFASWNRVNVSFYETVGGVKTVRATPLVDVIQSDLAKERVSSQRRRLGKING